MKSTFGFLNWNPPWGRISRRWNPFSDFAFDCKIRNPDFKLNLNTDFPIQRNPRVRGSWSRVWGEWQHAILWYYIRISSVSIHSSHDTKNLEFKADRASNNVACNSRGHSAMKNAGSGWRNTKDQESMQQLVQLETARSEHSRGKRQIQNKIDLRKGLWACETEQPSQTLVFTKTAGHKTWEKKEQYCY